MAIAVNIQTFLDEIEKLSNAEQLALAKVIWTDSFADADFKAHHKIISGIRSGDKIPLGKKGKGYTFMKSTKANTSQCDDNSCDLSLTLSTKEWNPGRYNCAVEVCYKDLATNFLDFFNSDKCSLDEITSSTFALFLKEWIASYVKDSLWVKTYFAELSATSTYLNGNDALFVQMLAAAPSGDKKRIEIPENSEATYTAQNALAADRGYKVFNEMYKKRSAALRKDKSAYIKTTRVLAENYLEWLREEKVVKCCIKDPLKGIYTEDALTIWGVPIKIIDQWDEIIDTLPEFNDGTKWDNPHRAILVSKDNAPVGTCEESNFSEFEMKVNNYTDMFKLVPEYTLDTQVLSDDDFVIAV